MSRGPGRRRATLLSAGLVIALLPAGQAAAGQAAAHDTGSTTPTTSATRAAAAAGKPADGPRTVTLVTGD
ncbi:hypothetical protein GTY54_37825, partial [Streptomyces sp. SID625]|nr:hypothetical protein [Streptomyces sp. SID625]